jgi:hypothetical protein
LGALLLEDAEAGEGQPVAGAVAMEPIDESKDVTFNKLWTDQSRGVLLEPSY